MVLVAIVAKLVPCGLASMRMGRRSAMIIGTGMVPRGEVGIIVAAIGLRTEAIGADVYSIIVAMSVLTTLIVPPFLRLLFRDRMAGATPQIGEVEEEHARAIPPPEQQQ